MVLVVIDHIIFSCGQNVILRLLKAVDFVVVTLIIGTVYITYWSMNVNLRLLRATAEFAWGGGVGGVCIVIFESILTSVLRLCYHCVVLSLEL